MTISAKNANNYFLFHGMHFHFLGGCDDAVLRSKDNCEMRVGERELS